MVEEKTGSDTPEMTDAHRHELATKLVDRFVLWSGAAGLIPVPIVDVAAVGGVQLLMLRRLSAIYDVPFSANRGKSVIASTVGSVVPAGVAGVASALKSVPAIGTTIGVLAMPAASAGATYVVGHTFIKHFDSGGTLLDFDPAKYREFIKEHHAKADTGSAAHSAA